MTAGPTPRRSPDRRGARLLLGAALLAGALAACGGDEEETAAAPPVKAGGAPDAQEITVLGTEGLDYEPATIEAVPGSLTLTLTNEGGPPHDLVFDDVSLPAIGAVGEGDAQSATYVFDGPGTYDFTCTFHPGMDGRVVVS